MKLSTSGLGQPSNEGEERECLNAELWHACAGPLVSLPAAGSRVVYFPQGHSEQVAATTNKEADGHVPNYPSLSPQLMCQLHNVTMHVDTETDEVYAQMTLQPLTVEEQNDAFLPMELGIRSNQPTNYFCKTLTASDTSTHGGFSVPRRAAEKVFPPLDFSQQPPAQELVARDLHDVEWNFRHIFRGQPKRHLLTTGWSVFVSAKRLVAGDSVLFIWNEKNELLLGIRRATRPQTAMPSSVLSSDSVHIGLLAAAAHAAATNSCFTIFYNPRASLSEFVIPLSKYTKAVFHTCISIGMRFRMLFETEESSVRRYMGTITGINDLDPVRWPNSHWRSVKVGWDESTTGERQPRVSLWQIEPLTTFPMYPSFFPLRLKRPWSPGPTSFLDHRDDVSNGFMWLGSGTGEQGLHSLNFQAASGFPWTQQRPDPAVLGNGQNQLYQAMLTAGLQNPGSGDLVGKQFMQFQQPFPSLQQSCSYNPMLQLQRQQQAIQPQVPPNMLQAQNQIPTESLAEHVPHQRLNNQPEDHTLQQQNMYHDSHLSQMQRQESSVPSPSFPNSEHTDLGIKFSSSTASIQKMMDSSYAGVGDNLFDLTKTERSSLTEQLSQQSWVKYAHSQVNAFTSSMAPLRTYPQHTNSSPDDQNSSIFGANIDSSGLLLPITMHRFPNSSIDAAKSSMVVPNSGFQNSMHVCAQDSELLPSEGQPDTPNSSQTFVKVYKSGSVGRSLDISRFHSYNELQEELGQMFAMEGKLKNPQRSGWQLIFVDRENDVLLLGDDPWESFVNNVWYIKILSPEEVQKMGGQGVDFLNPICQRMSGCGDLGLASGLRRNRK